MRKRMDIHTLRAMRKTKKVPQNAIAKALGCSRSRVSEAEHGWVKLNYKERQQFLVAIEKYSKKKRDK